MHWHSRHQEEVGEQHAEGQHERSSRDLAGKNLETAFYANSSRAAKESKRKTNKDILDAAKEYYNPKPLFHKAHCHIAATLKEAVYKSAYTYLIEASHTIWNKVLTGPISSTRG